MKKSNLILGFYVGVIALCVATVSMSIAWYASSTQVRIDGIVMTIDADRDLGISTEKEGNYVEEIDVGDLMEVDQFMPVTAAHSSRWRNTKADKPVFYDDTQYSTFEHAETSVKVERGYFSQSIYLKSDDDIFVTIDPSNTYINPNSDYNKAYASILYDEYQHGDDESLKNLTEEEIEGRLDKLVEAMRFSILIPSEQDYDYAIIDPHKTSETLFGGLLDNNINQYYDHFYSETDHKNYERVYGEYIGEPKYYDEPTASDSGYLNPNEDPNAFNARHKAGLYQIDPEKSENAGFEIVTENSIALEDFNKDNKPFRIPVYRNQPQEIVLSIYIEGWDLESINHTKGATFDSKIQFKIEREQ